MTANCVPCLKTGCNILDLQAPGFNLSGTIDFSGFTDAHTNPGLWSREIQPPSSLPPSLDLIAGSQAALRLCSLQQPVALLLFISHAFIEQIFQKNRKEK